MIILTHKVNTLVLINQMGARICHLYAMVAGLPACNPLGGGNGFVNLAGSGLGSPGQASGTECCVVVGNGGGEAYTGR
jgi:hypothetical protein